MSLVSGVNYFCNSLNRYVPLGITAGGSLYGAYNYYFKKNIDQTSDEEITSIFNDILLEYELKRLFKKMKNIDRIYRKKVALSKHLHILLKNYQEYNHVSKLQYRPLKLRITIFFL